MANIFTNAKNFIKDTLKQAATTDNLRDFAHANRLFVGSDFRLVPKHGAMFHVFFDINPNPQLANNQVSKDPNRIELGLMVKSVALPKYDIATKKLNSYNRQNIIQTRITYDDITIKFHDDSANIVRNFWYDYYRYYYRSSDYQESVYRQNYKYRPQDNGRFGYSLRAELNSETIEPYLQSIRIYSLHQRKFSEYILINPLIRNFRHGAHSYSETNLLDHDMVIEYENILYSEGSVAPRTVKGFAQLHYDNRPSPLKQGGIKSIFGQGGLFDSATSILGVIGNPNSTVGDYINAGFLAARTINTARSMNLKKAALGELTTYYTRESARVLTNTVGRYAVPNFQSSPGAGNKFSGIETATSVALTAGAAVILNSVPSSPRYRNTPIQQSTSSQTPPSNYNPSLPKVFGYTAPASAGTTNQTLNDTSTIVTNQRLIDINQQISEIDGQVDGLNSRLGTITAELTQAQTQLTNTTQALAQLNTDLATAQAIVPSNAQAASAKAELISSINAKIVDTTLARTQAQNDIASRQSIITSLNTSINNLLARRKNLG